MAGVLFIVSVPNEELEKALSFKYGQKAEEEQQQLTTRTVNSTTEVNNINEKKPAQTVVNGGTNVNFQQDNNEDKAKLQSNGIKDKDEDSPASLKEDNAVLDDDLHDLPEHESMVKTVEDILKRLNIENASWSEKSDKYVQVTFLLESSRCEKTLAILYDFGIGQRYKSIVSVVPCSVFYEGTEEKEKDEEVNGNLSEDEKKQQVKDSAWNRFLSSVRARLTVNQVVEGVKTSATLTFDYAALLTVAAFVCAIGLVENSNVYLVSSMLISPLMGPVLAATFGTVIQDRNLQKLGVTNLLLGIGVCIVVGFAYGIIICLGSDREGESWPTSEMISRGQLKTLWVGGIVALLSGAAVALGILGDNVASLVGVAISTSLLPPAVNAGLFWSMALIYGIDESITSRKNIYATEIYSEDCAWELCALGGVSLCLTLVNVICIYIAGIVVFKVKEVAPIARGSQRRFWRHDIKIARDYNKTLQNEDARNMRKLLSNEVAGLNNSDSRDSLEHQLTEHFRRSSEMGDIASPGMRSTQYTWSPSTRGHQHTSIRDLEDLYLTLVHEKPTPSHPSHRNLSFFIPNRGRRSLFDDCDENGLPPIPEIPGSSSGGGSSNMIRSRFMSQNSPPSRITSTLFGTKKFIVTPAASDPLLEDGK